MKLLKSQLRVIFYGTFSSELNSEKLNLTSVTIALPSFEREFILSSPRHLRFFYFILFSLFLTPETYLSIFFKFRAKIHLLSAGTLQLFFLYDFTPKLLLLYMITYHPVTSVSFRNRFFFQPPDCFQMFITITFS